METENASGAAYGNHWSKFSVFCKVKETPKINFYLTLEYDRRRDRIKTTLPSHSFYAGSENPSNRPSKTRLTTGHGRTRVLCLVPKRFWCEWRESDPRPMLGKHMYCHYTTLAMLSSFTTPTNRALYNGPAENIVAPLLVFWRKHSFCH